MGNRLPIGSTYKDPIESFRSLIFIGSNSDPSLKSASVGHLAADTPHALLR